MVRRSSRRGDRHGMLATLGRALGAAPDERRADDVVRRHVIESCGAEHVALIACGPERGRATLRDPAGSFPLLASGAVSAGACLTVRLGRPHARRRGDTPTLVCELCGSFDADTACAPLTAAGAVIGAVLATGRALDKDAEQVLDDIAAVAGPSIAGLRAFDLASAHAHTDPLTALPNRRSADEAAERMTALARRSAQSLSVMVVDLDGISALNDRLGVEAGDDVIYSLAALLRARLRTSDLVARVAGDEFLVLLPDTSSEAAVELARGLCRLTHELTPRGAPDPVTVSVGIAAFPLDGESATDVIAAAQRALVEAKTAGGDRVSAIEPPDPSSLFDAP